MSRHIASQRYLNPHHVPENPVTSYSLEVPFATLEGTRLVASARDRGSHGFGVCDDSQYYR